MSRPGRIELIDYDESRVDEIVALWRPSFELAVGQPSIHTADEDRQFICTILSVEQHMILACEIASAKLVGFAAYTSDECTQLYVDVHRLGEGIGSVLLERIQQLCPGGLRLYTFASNLRAQRFYEKHGFVVIGRNYPNELNLPDLRYEWKP